MEYIAAMDYELDHILPTQDPIMLSIFTNDEDALGEDDDFFTDDSNRDMTPAAMWTELGSLPLLIRRSSSKCMIDVFNDKENCLSRCSSLSKHHSIPRNQSLVNGTNSLSRCVSLSKTQSIPRNQSLENGTGSLSRCASLSKSHSIPRNQSLVNGMNSLSRCSSLSTSHNIPRNESLVNSNSNIMETIREPLQNIKLVCSSSLGNVTKVPDTDEESVKAYHCTSESDDDKEVGEVRETYADATEQVTLPIPIQKENEEIASEIYKAQVHQVRKNCSDPDPMVIESQQMHKSSSLLAHPHEDGVQEKQGSMEVDIESQNNNYADENNEKNVINKSSLSAESQELQQNSKTTSDPSYSNDTFISQVSENAILIPQKTVKESMKNNKRTAKYVSDDSPTCKKMKTIHQTPRKAIMCTRQSAANLLKQRPNHSVASISQKKVQIFKAAQDGDLQLIRELLHHTGPTIRNGKENNTLLHIAADSNQCDVLLHMINLISSNIVNIKGQTPAHIAAEKGHLQILQILLSDKEFNPEKRDINQKTFKDLLVDPLFKAVLEGDEKRTDTLINLGADPDCYAGESVDGILARELGVTTARQLANILHEDDFIYPSDELAAKLLKQSPIADPISRSHKGYVCILNFEDFSAKPELNRRTSRKHINNLAILFQDMGFKGEVFTSLTAKEAEENLGSLTLNGSLDDVQCGVFIISSHSVDRESFLTTDLQVLTTSWVMNFFKVSECPQLRNKPKIFIFDFDSTYYVTSLGLKSEERPVRVEEPFSNMICLYSEFDKEATQCSNVNSFLSVLCHTLMHHGPSSDILSVHLQMLKEYARMNKRSFPELRNFGLTTKFCLDIQTA